MTDTQYKNTLYEVDEILKIFDKTLLDKIPERLKREIKENKSENYNFKIDYNKSLDEQKMLETTEQYLTALYLKYWCNQAEKEEVLKAMHKNEIRYQEKIKKRYNPDDIFKQPKKESEIKQDITKNNIFMIEYKESIIKKIFNKIKSFFEF